MYFRQKIESIFSKIKKGLNNQKQKFEISGLLVSFPIKSPNIPTACIASARDKRAIVQTADNLLPLLYNVREFLSII